MPAKSAKKKLEHWPVLEFYGERKSKKVPWDYWIITSEWRRTHYIKTKWKKVISSTWKDLAHYRNALSSWAKKYGK